MQDTETERKQILEKVKAQIDELNNKVSQLEDKAYLAREDAQEIARELKNGFESTLARFKRVVATVKDSASQAIDAEWNEIKKDAEGVAESVEETISQLKE